MVYPKYDNNFQIDPELFFFYVDKEPQFILTLIYMYDPGSIYDFLVTVVLFKEKFTSAISELMYYYAAQPIPFSVML